MVNCSGTNGRCPKDGKCEKQIDMKNYGIVDPALVARFSEHDMCWDF